MQTVNIHEAKTHPPRLIEKAAKGEAFIIAKAGKSTVKVVPLEDTDAFFSPASIWETAIRHAQARPDFRADPSILRERLSFKTAKSRCPSTKARTCYRSTPPFDRILIAQSKIECIPLVTVDNAVLQYPGLQYPGLIGF